MRQTIEPSGFRPTTGVGGTAGAEGRTGVVEREASATTPHTPHKPWWHLALRVTGLLVIAVVVVSVLKHNMPSPGSIWAAIRGAHWWWVVAAAGSQAASIGMMIRQQWRLLRAFGVSVSHWRVGAITYSSTAISNSLPAGSAVGAGYSYRQFRASGATPVTAGTVLLISGALSISALVALYLAGLGLDAVSRFSQLGQAYPWLAVLIGLGLVAVIAALCWLTERSGRGAHDDHAPTPRLDSVTERHPRIGSWLHQLLLTGRQARQVRGRDWRIAFLASALNWALDMGCLYASCRAFDIHVNLFTLGMIYLGIQVVRQIPITPGGIGVIETVLLAALVAAHAARGPASAAVIVYRLFAAWLIVPIGYVMFAVLSRKNRRAALAAAA